jgi:hypothetical protein
MKKHFSSLPFKDGNFYTATGNQTDRNFEVGKKYKCVKIDKPQHFHMNLQKDGSTLKFVNPEGVECGYFGSVAINYFSDDKHEITEAFNQYMKYTHDEILRSKNEMEVKLSIVIRNIENIRKQSLIRNELIKRANEHNLTINTSLMDIDKFAIDSQINALKSVTANINKAIKQKPSNLDKFLQTTEGKNLIKNHSLTETGVWEVFGEDSNCDLGGSHTMPRLGAFEGELKKVLIHVVELPGFWQWGSGGRVTKYNTPPVTKIV